MLAISLYQHHCLDHMLTILALRNAFASTILSEAELVVDMMGIVLPQEGALSTPSRITGETLHNLGLIAGNASIIVAKCHEPPADSLHPYLDIDAVRADCACRPVFPFLVVIGSGLLVAAVRRSVLISGLSKVHLALFPIVALGLGCGISVIST